MNTNSRTIFIGDIHGCYDELKLLLKKLNIQKSDMIYFTGDMINKGPKSYKVIKFLYKNQKQFKAIKGNHEVWFLNSLKLGNSNYITKKLKKIQNKFLKNPEKLDFIKNLPLYIETNDFILVHGGVIPNKELIDHTEDEFTKLREIKGELWYKLYKGAKKVIYGHNALDGLQIRQNTIGLDSGCVYGKMLTAYILETGEIYTQNALNNYINLYKTDSVFIKLFKKIFKIK